MGITVISIEVIYFICTYMTNNDYTSFGREIVLCSRLSVCGERAKKRASAEKTSGDEGERIFARANRSPSSPLVFSALARFFALSPQTESLEQVTGESSVRTLKIANCACLPTHTSLRVDWSKCHNGGRYNF